MATWAGVAYVAFVVDTFFRRIVGWSAATSKETRLVLDTLEMALWQRDLNEYPYARGELIHHSDAGSQYTSLQLAEHAEQECALVVADVVLDVAAHQAPGVGQLAGHRLDRGAGPGGGVTGQESSHGNHQGGGVDSLTSECLGEGSGLRVVALLLDGVADLFTISAPPRRPSVTVTSPWSVTTVRSAAPSRWGQS